ncbi:class I SAM-dependent methyltransferase [Marinihelvus fidelis]|uniref:Class I SAM-dependent methyltransferase n=1 Tax=Marinihelvus fidelis TaxID=2613842 RepID=A0A5N0TDL6_9GAMM|nr:class I SAM-dependent methyltransferase [Marinihelvus fidelis]KAA9133060.1 class I SAM-dependent methyltransferase [Marinihelvus fidelis]
MSTIAEKFKTIFWFVQRPDHWSHMAGLVLRKFRKNHDSAALRAAATAWANEQAEDADIVLESVGLELNDESRFELPKALVTEAKERVSRCPLSMGGPGDLDLIAQAVVRIGAARVIETGVAYGWSSLAILAALEHNKGGRLVSVDMPYPKMDNEPWVGVAVPDRLRSLWKIIRKPDRNGLKEAIAEFDGQIDLCHYDSDKSWWGRRYAYPLLWRALRPGGILISDDIQDNFAFKNFVEKVKPRFGVTECEGKYVGIVVKPLAFGNA